MNYQDFIKSKRHSEISYGVKPKWMPGSIFDFQRHIAEYSIKKGRCAIFLDTGLGKTLIELTIAHNYAIETGKPVLIITPLAVASQFVKEAEKFGVPSVSHTKDGSYNTDIVLVNYERLHYLDSNDFDCVILDESSILKNFDGKIKSRITAFLRKVKYRFLATATPSPNDYIELGTSSEALGYMGYTDMLGKFFKNNNNSIDARHAGAKWYLKPHAHDDFWAWVNTWSISARKPSDLGYSDDGYILPDLIENKIIIRNDKPLAINGQHSLFALPAVNFFEIRKEAKATIPQRCESAVSAAREHDKTVYWCNLNDESDLLSELDNDSVEVRGSMSIDQKEDILSGFSNGEINKLITKTSITAFGLNWQHCNHTTYFPTYSYEQYYQAIRRFWRFGQKNPVTVDIVLSDGQKRIMNSLEVKRDKAIEMFENLIKETRSEYNDETKQFNKDIVKPGFL